MRKLGLLLPVLLCLACAARSPDTGSPARVPAVRLVSAPAFEFRIGEAGSAAVTVSDQGLTLDELGRKIKEAGDQHPAPDGLSDLKLVIHAQGGTPWTVVQAVMRKCLDARVWRVSFAPIKDRGPQGSLLTSDKEGELPLASVQGQESLTIEVVSFGSQAKAPIFKVGGWSTGSSDTLTAQLKRVRQVRDLPVIIAGRPDCSFGHVLSAMDCCVRAGFRQVDFQQPKASGGQTQPK
jgi:biopolymer transport protein ExbD